MIHVLVTGANGQLGQSLKEISIAYPEIKFHFKDSEDLDITKAQSVRAAFESFSYEYCINCAAFTAVDRAETESENAFLVNSEGVKLLAIACKQQNTILIHISTDFVFDGLKNTPYNELDISNPINVYGASKLAGENHVKSILDSYFIIRTSWLYSEFGNNFLKTMIRLSSEKKELRIVNDQIGTPTYAKDLAKAIIHIVISKSKDYGIYHYSNEGAVSWHEFANAIFELSQSKIETKGISTDNYPTLAKRPKYSVLSKNKIKRKLGLITFHWRDSLEDAVSIIFGNQKIQ